MPGKSNETEGSASNGVIISTPVAVEVIGLLPFLLTGDPHSISREKE